jgi:hypothetical protein
LQTAALSVSSAGRRHIDLINGAEFFIIHHPVDPFVRSFLRTFRLLTVRSALTNFLRTQKKGLQLKLAALY